MSHPLILVVEDEIAISELIRYNLERAEYRCLVAEDGEIALELAQSQDPPALIVLDWMLPKALGIEVCEQLRQEDRTRAIPIIMLTAKGEEVDKIKALNAGADDYIVKPFSPAELVARIGAVLRRGPKEAAAGSIACGPIELDLKHRRFRLNGLNVHLAPTEFRLLQIFAQSPGKLFSRDELLELIWGKGVHVEDRTVDVHIRRLRKVFSDAEEENLIRTVRSGGYMLDLTYSNPSNSAVDK